MSEDIAVSGRGGERHHGAGIEAAVACGVARGGHSAAGAVHHLQVDAVGAVGHHLDMVNIGDVLLRARGGGYGHPEVAARDIAEVDPILLPYAVGCYLRGADGLEGGEVVGVGHHADGEVAAAIVLTIGAEDQLEVLHAVRKLGQHGAAIGRGVAVEQVGIGAFVIRRGGGTGIVGVVAENLPAGADGCGGGAARGILKAVAVGRCHQGAVGLEV